MKIVEDYLNKHHFFKAPHKWFFAFLSSPIHFCEMRYKKRYHLTFVHAKKLFFFDILLVLSVFVLSAITAAWFLYDPSIVDKITLSIDASEQRIASGENITYIVSYGNTNHEEIKGVNLSFHLPQGFVLQDTKPTKIFNPQTRTFDLGNLPPGATGNVEISGTFYGIPEIEDRVQAELSYYQHDRPVQESKKVSIITTLRGSLLEASADVPKHILGQSEVPIYIEIMMDNTQHIKQIAIPLPQNNEFLFTGKQPSLGTIINNVWTIDISSIQSKVKANLHGTLTINIRDKKEHAFLHITPRIKVNNNWYDQKTITKQFTVVHPNIESHMNWQNGTEGIHPGSAQPLIVFIKNNGSTALSDLSVSIDIPNTVHSQALIANNQGEYSNGSFTVSKKHAANLASLEPGASTELTLSIPTNKLIHKGSDIFLELDGTLSGSIPNITQGIYSREINSPSIALGTNLSLNAESRYYTVDGDQLGRGPLPPQVGKQTKYWALISIQNTTSDVERFQLSATLPSYVEWTGKSSVSHGSKPVFNEKTRTISWSIPSLKAHTKPGIYFELGLTPTDSQRNSMPTLLENIRITGKDSHIQKDLLSKHTALDISLKDDKKAQQKGTKVK